MSSILNPVRQAPTPNSATPPTPRAALPNLRSSAIPALVGIVLVSFLIYVYTFTTALPQNIELAGTAFVIQLICWAAVLMIIVLRSRHHTLRVSDTLVLAMFWMTLYYVYPSITWLTGSQELKWASHLVPTLIPEALVLQGLFMLFFTLGIVFVNRKPGVIPNVDSSKLPKPWLIFIMPFAVIFVTFFARFLTTGQFIASDQSYGDWAIERRNLYSDLRGSGTLEYLLVQFQSIFGFIIVLAQGGVLGMILSRIFQRKRGWITYVVIIGACFGGAFFLGTGDRSGYLIMMLVGVVVADVLVGPIRWQYLLLPVVAGFVVMDFVTIYRLYNYLPFNESIPLTVETYLSPDRAQYKDFTAMLGKTTIVMDAVQNGQAQVTPLQYLAYHSLLFLPTQLNPLKGEYQNTAAMIAVTVYSNDIVNRAGTANTMVGDSYRFMNGAGVPIVAFILGAGMALIEKWALNTRGDFTKTSLLKIVLFAGIVANTFRVPRSDPGAFSYMFFYYVIVPYVFFMLVTQRNGRNRWIKPLREYFPGGGGGEQKEAA